MNKVKNMKKIISVLLLGLSVLLQTNNGFASPGNFLKRGLKKANQRVQKTLNGNSALHCAVKTEKLQNVKLVYKRNPELLEKVNDKGETPLFIAISDEEDKGYENLSIVKYLIKDCSANVNVTNNEDESLLFTAIISERTDIIRWLLAAGASINIVNPLTGNSALYMAVSRDYKMTSMFLFLGANIDEINDNGELPKLYFYYGDLLSQGLSSEQAIAEEREKLEGFRRQINEVSIANGKDVLPEFSQISSETMDRLNSEFKQRLEKENESCRKCGYELYIVKGYNDNPIANQQPDEYTYGVRN